FSARGVRLIDFGLSIDRRLYEEGTTFVGRSGTSSFECAEMKEGRAWTEQGDLHALCGVIHALLHNEYMEVEAKAEEGQRLVRMPRMGFKRYWQVSMWTEFFSSLLNVGSCEQVPDKRTRREELEGYFERNESKRSAVRMALIKQELLLHQPQ
ncbi:hypothetical protein GUITHDRAFT_75304, partial [Guillardia theta CCMP2712]